jgi:hypothetical protein
VLFPQHFHEGFIGYEVAVKSFHYR